MKRVLEGSPICERCGLRVVTRELARQGVIMQFCDECDWGVAVEETSPESGEIVGEAPAGTRRTA